jgi:hypothetical protein
MPASVAPQEDVKDRNWLLIGGEDVLDATPKDPCQLERGPETRSKRPFSMEMMVLARGRVCQPAKTCVVQITPAESTHTPTPKWV